MTRRSFLVFVAAAAIVAAAFGPAVSSATPLRPAEKLLGGLRALVDLGVQPDQRLEYLVPEYRPDEFVVYALVDRDAESRVGDVSDSGATVRWAFRSIDAISLVATREQLLTLASRPWVRALYPVASGRFDQVPTIQGTIARGEAPHVHTISVPAGSHSITVDLTVAPPTVPHWDFNVTDFLEARLLNPRHQVVKVRPAFLHQISFRYGETSLQQGNWTLEIWHRTANRPVAPITFVYAGNATASTDEVTRDSAAPVPAPGCSGPADATAWRKQANLKRRGVTDLGAPVLWDRGIRGRGVRVAVLDTGIDGTHVDLDDQDWEHWGQSGCAQKIVADALFLAGQKFDGQGAHDNGGHGTHVAGEITGTAEGTSDGERAAYPGVAPEASLVAGRIAIDVTALSDDMLAAAEWAVIDQRVDVVSLSFGIDVRYGVLTDQNDPQTAGFEALATNPAWGFPTINVAASNSGDKFYTIAAPGAAAHVNTIAAATKDWDLDIRSGEARENGATTGRAAKDSRGRVHPSIAIFSSRGPTHDFFFAPDLAAPGRDIVATETNDLGTTNTDGTKNGYVSFSGTSMATPHASGASALLIDGYRQHFGASGAFGNRPPFWLVAAAFGNTAGAPASRPSFAGGALGKVSYEPDSAGVYQMYGERGSREGANRPVGSLVEGAGRINVPAALDALTNGVVIYTAGNPAAPGPYDLQASVHAGVLKPGESSTRTLALHPANSHEFAVRFRTTGGIPSLNANAIPAGWWSLPGETSVSGSDVTSPVALHVPAGTVPGIYTGYVFAEVTDHVTGVHSTLRLPAMVVVQIPDYSAGEGEGNRANVDGYTRAYDVTTFLTTSLVDSVNNDWPMYAVDVPEGTQSLVLGLTGKGDASDDWDLLLFDDRGEVVASTVDGLPTTTPSLTATGLMPGRYRIAVSLTNPSSASQSIADPRGVAYTLTADLVGAATQKPATVRGVHHAKPKPAKGGALPSTGDESSAALALVALAIAAIFGARLRRE